MKKYYIITYSNNSNYGSFWQAFALQTACENFVEIQHIKYISRPRGFLILKDINKSRLFSPSNAFSTLRGVFRKFKKSNKKLADLLSQNISEAKAKYIKYTEPYNMKTIKALDDENAVFIAGSDQLWSNKAMFYNALYAYLLGFVSNPKSKNSYAASFGFKEIPKKLKGFYAEKLQSFNKIAVREADGAKIIKELINRDAKVVLDPTLLLNKQQWEKHIPMQQYNEKYILVYAIRLKLYDDLLVYAKKLSELTGYKIYSICCEPSDKMENCIVATCEEFLNRIHQAEFVVTHSYHATIFSINFNKKFFVNPYKSNQLSQQNTRMSNILGLLDLKDRIIDDNTDLLKSIDYDAVNTKLEALRLDSMGYLEDILTDSE